jgi:hypothetical protein
MKTKVTIFISILLLCIICYKGISLLHANDTNQDKEIAELYEAYTIQNEHNIDFACHHVLCIGNSITKHPVRKEVGWFSPWGMAASRQDSDYCHRLLHKLQQYNKGTTLKTADIGPWERNLNCNIDSLIGKDSQGVDLIIIRMGENVQNVQNFQTKIFSLINYCKKYTNNIIITGCFWKNDEKEKAIINAAREENLKYVPLNWIGDLYKDKVLPKMGDTIYTPKGKTYTISNVFVAKHPNDEGMRLIANSIFGAISFKK